jgi:hypothetical protein
MPGDFGAKVIVVSQISDVNEWNELDWTAP